MNRIRLATEEEVKSIQDTSDLDSTCSVLALDTTKGTAFAVRRFATELDPVITPNDWEPRSKILFYRDLETHLWSQGVLSYYFNVQAEGNDEWLAFLKKWGAEKVSTEPEFRFKKVL